jgi:hypothetical protein
MIITFLIFIAIATVVHKLVMGAVENYSYDNTIDRYEDRIGKIYWDAIKEPRRFN